MSKYPELEDAIEKMQSEGYQEDFIRKETLKSGYTEEELKNSLDLLESQQIRNKYISYGITFYFLPVAISVLILQFNLCSILGGAKCAFSIIYFLPILGFIFLGSSLLYFCLCFFTKNISLIKAIIYLILSLIPTTMFFSYIFLINLFL